MAWIIVTNASNRKMSVQVSQVRKVVSDGSGGTIIYYAGCDGYDNVKEPLDDVMRDIYNAEREERLQPRRP